MTHPGIAKILQLGPVRRFLERSGGNPLMGNLYSRLSGAAIIHDSMDHAREAIRLHRPETRGHFESDLIESNFSSSVDIRTSDYPVLFWMRVIAETQPLRVFDFGGGMGQLFASYSRLLHSGLIAAWTVQDLQQVILQVCDRHHPGGDPPNLKFTTRLRDGVDSNVFLAAGSLHYWEKSIADLLAELGTRPRHFIVNRSPMPGDGSSFCTVQEGAYWAVACRVRSLADLQAEMETEGYELVDVWIDSEKKLTFPWLPACSCPYRGCYFRKT